MRGVLQSTDPTLQCGTEPIFPSDPSRGFSVIGYTPDECAVEIKVKPAEGGLEIKPFRGKGVATSFLKAYQHVLEREVAGQ